MSLATGVSLLGRSSPAYSHHIKDTSTSIHKGCTAPATAFAAPQRGASALRRSTRRQGGWQLRASPSQGPSASLARMGASLAPAAAPRPRPAASAVESMSHPDGLRAAAPAAAAAGAGPTAAGAAPAAPGSLRVAIVGDVHGAWRPEREEAALRFLNPDITLLVGDFGNENVELVRQIAALPLRKAVILGNHDAWFTMKGGAAAGARRPAVQQQLSAADLLQALQRGEGVTAEQDGVRKQLAALGPEHVGYGTLALQEQGYTVVGARPFSKGGKNFSSIRPFMMSLYGVQSMEESAFRITQVANSAAEEHALIFMGHNGPAGLGSRAWDICGVDWESKAGDHGDPDLQMALGNLAACGRRVALVTFGHMHHHLSARGSHGLGHRYRRMAHIDPDTGTVFLNSATVPRVMPAPPLPTAPHDHHLDDHHSDHHKRPHGSGSNSAGSSPPTSPKAYGSGRRARMAAKAAAAAAAAAAAGVHGADDASSSGGGAEAATAHHFMFVQMEGGEVVSARDVWVQVTPVADDLEAAEVLAALTAAAAVAEVEAPAASTAAAVAAGADGNGDGGAATAAATATTSTSSSDGEATETVAVAVPPSAPQRVGDFVVHTLRQHEVVRTVAAAEPGKVVKFVWNAYDQLYEPVVLNRQAVGTNVGTGAAQAATDRVPGEDGADAAAVVVVDAAEGTKEVVAVEAH